MEELVWESWVAVTVRGTPSWKHDGRSARLATATPLARTSFMRDAMVWSGLRSPRYRPWAGLGGDRPWPHVMMVDARGS